MGGAGEINEIGLGGKFAGFVFLNFVIDIFFSAGDNENRTKEFWRLTVVNRYAGDALICFERLNNF